MKIKNIAYTRICIQAGIHQLGHVIYMLFELLHTQHISILLLLSQQLV